MEDPFALREEDISCFMPKLFRYEAQTVEVMMQGWRFRLVVLAFVPDAQSENVGELSLPISRVLWLWSGCSCFCGEWQACEK